MKITASGGGRPKVVVVGGDFGGVNVTRKLAKADVDVTLVDRTNHHLFQPLLYPVATGIMPEGLIAPALRRVCGQANDARHLRDRILTDPALGELLKDLR